MSSTRYDGAWKERANSTERPQRPPQSLSPDRDQRDRQEVRADDLDPCVVRVGKQFRQVPDIYNNALRANLGFLLWLSLPLALGRCAALPFLRKTGTTPAFSPSSRLFSPAPIPRLRQVRLRRSSPTIDRFERDFMSRIEDKRQN